jgi:hypothetical protein
MNNEQTDKEKAEAFEKEYNDLCVKHKLILTFQPQWKQSQDTGTWSLVIVPMLAKFEPPVK